MNYYICRYCLTEKGTDVAIKLSLLRNENQKIQIETNNSKIVVSEEKKSTKSPNKSPKQKCTETNVKENRNEALSKQTVNIENTLKSTVTPYNGDVEETIFMLPNSFEIILLVDNQERDK